MCSQRGKQEENKIGGNFPEKMNVGIEWREGKFTAGGGDKKEETLKTRCFVKDFGIFVKRIRHLFPTKMYQKFSLELSDC